MNKLIIILIFLHIALVTSAQTILSNQISRFSGIYEQIDFYDEEGSTVLSLAPRFYRQREIKKWVKPIKVNNQTYFIKCKYRVGVQSVYTDSGEHVANIERNGTEIHLVQDGSIYVLRPRLNWVNRNILECRNSEGTMVSTISWNNDRRLAFENNSNQNPNFLLLSLCAHQYQELLLGERGRLSAQQFDITNITNY